MVLHYLNCGTIRPCFPPVESGVTCLLAATDRDLVLVDTGLGTGDRLQPGRWMRFFTLAMHLPRDLSETALHQVRRLGYQPGDVRHIVMTHLHLDHAGGLPDFPRAQVHVYQPEVEHATGGRAEIWYVGAHWAHRPNWAPHMLAGSQWYGFDAIPLDGLGLEIWLVPLPGHTVGHCGVALCTAQGWVLHAGDAVPFNLAFDQAPGWISSLLLGPHVPRLRAFMRAHPEVQVVGGHMALGFYASPPTS